MNRLMVVIIFVVVIICGLVVTDLFAQEAVTTADLDISAKEQVVYPAEISATTDKLVYALKVQEAARRLHNDVGLWTKGAVDEKTYNAWPEDVRAVLPAWKEGATLSQEDFEKFREVYEENYSQPAVNDILAIKEEIRKLTDAELNVTLEGVKK